MENSLQRKIPFSLEAEQAVLGSILNDPAKYDVVAEQGLSSNDFYLAEHREIFLAMQKLYLSSRNIDIITLINTLVADGIYDKERSISYIKTISNIVPSTSNINDYIKIVKDKSLKRKIIEVCDSSSDMAIADSDPAEDVLDAVSGKIYALSDNIVRHDFEHIRQVLIDTYAMIKKAASSDGTGNGVTTGFTPLDNVLVGMGAGDLVLVGARPGMGKTAFALNIAVNASKKMDKAICIFSLEMSSAQLAMRMLASEALVNSYSLRSGKLDEAEWAKLASASSFLAERNIYIDDTPGVSVSQMRAKLRRIKNVGLIVIDYLQLMQSDKRSSDNRVQEVGDISRNLKLMAKEMGIPVVCCAQLSRGPESRENKRPMLSDLRDSGAIEQDADSVMFLYREEYYKDTGDEPKQAEVIVAKNRHGSLENVKLNWYGEFTKFATASDRDDPV